MSLFRFALIITAHFVPTLLEILDKQINFASIFAAKISLFFHLKIVKKIIKVST